ncbi:hypothetical protein LCGC14_0646820 [marine sediment metagenome]|uniref:Uncharacterized protein n=1 Tax=marine sediment metagenome TaxID=412755 RepID=A0A0F9QXG9_9ZZZZ|nr:hypothetical protein [Pricia sp.]
MGTTTTQIKQPLFSRKHGGGMFSVIDEHITTGNIFWVDSGQTSTGAITQDVGFGLTPDQPFLTLASALSQCTTANGDMIFLMPGHAETPVTTITINVAGVTIIGLGNGANRPSFTAAHTVGATDVLDITVANVTIKNIVIPTGANSGGDSQIVNIAAGGHDFLMEDCKIEMGAINLECFTVAADAKRGTLKNIKVVGTAANPNTIITFEGVNDKWEIDGLDGIFTAATDIDGPVVYQNAVVIDDLLIRNVRVLPIEAAGVFLDFNSASVGIVDNATGYTLAATVGEMVDLGSMMFNDVKLGGAGVLGMTYPNATLAA